MSIAALQGQLLSLTMQHSNIQNNLALLNTRRQELTSKSGELMDKYLQRMQSSIDNKGHDEPTANIQT